MPRPRKKPISREQARNMENQRVANELRIFAHNTLPEWITYAKSNDPLNDFRDKGAAYGMTQVHTRLLKILGVM